MSRICGVWIVGGKELADITCREIREELGKRHLLKSGVKSVIRGRLRKALADEEWSEVAVSHWHLAVSRCELSTERVHGGKEDDGE